MSGTNAGDPRGGDFPFITWGLYRRRYVFRTPEASRPLQFTIDPKNRIRVGPTPRLGGYTVYGEFQRRAQVLAQHDDEPMGLKREHNRVVVWRAVMLAQGHDEANDAYQYAASNFAESYNQLYRAQTPAVRVAGAIA